LLRHAAARALAAPGGHDHHCHFGHTNSPQFLGYALARSGRKGYWRALSAMNSFLQCSTCVATRIG
jgi:hypothetical protein